LDHVPDDCLPPWDFDAASDDPVDSSAGAIAAVGLLRLAALEQYDEFRRRWQQSARALVAALCHHVTPLHDGDARRPGMLLDGCYHRPARVAEANELIWGDYYLLEALSILTGTIDPSRH